MGRSADVSRNRARHARLWPDAARAVARLMLLTLPLFVLVAGGIAVLDSVSAAKLPTDQVNCMGLAAIAGLLLVYFVALFKISDQQRDLAFAQHCDTWR
jgi:cytochrome bd-type quinol oxidase subunit 2